MKAIPFVQLRLILLGLIPLVLISPAWSYTKTKQEVSDLKTRDFLTQLRTDTPKSDLPQKNIPRTYALTGNTKYGVCVSGIKT